MIRVSLYQPDIAPNVGSLIRLCACLEVPLDIIEPCGFAFDMRRIRQTAMDYIDHVELVRHQSWEEFLAFKERSLPESRLCLLTTKGSTPLTEHQFESHDIVLCGRESAGVPGSVHDAVDQRLRIPLSPHTRSLNIASAATIALTQALQHTSQWPKG